MPNTAGSGASIWCTNNGYTDYEPLVFNAEHIQYWIRDSTFSASEKIRIDSSGNLLVGTNSARTPVGITPKFQVEGTGADSSISIIRNANSTSNPYLFFAKSRSASTGGSTIVQSGDNLGAIYFAGADGTDIISYAAKINCAVDGTPGANDMPGRLTFLTTADGAATPTERMKIDSSGDVTITDGDLVIGTAGHGIDFSAQTHQGGMTSELLDHYEEGTWTPNIGGNATYTNQVGKYIRIGNQVWAHFALTINVQGTGSATGRISGLPFASGIASQNCSNFTWGGLGVSIIYGVYYVGASATYLSFSYSASAGTGLSNNPNSLISGAGINGSIVYTV